MTPDHPVQRAQYYRDEAARLRRDADAITHQMIRRQVLDVAADYDGLAETVETINRQRGDH
jgi:hypothetical protein